MNWIKPSKKANKCKYNLFILRAFKSDDSFLFGPPPQLFQANNYKASMYPDKLELTNLSLAANTSKNNIRRPQPIVVKRNVLPDNSVSIARN